MRGHGGTRISGTAKPCKLGGRGGVGHDPNAEPADSLHRLVRADLAEGEFTAEQIAERHDITIARVELIANKGKRPNRVGADDLTDKERAFCMAYVMPDGLTISQAAAAAGYCGEYGSALLDRPRIKAWILAWREKVALDHTLTVEELVLEAKRVAFFDVRKIRRDGEFVPIEEMDDDTAAAIGSVEYNEDGSIKKLTREKKMDALNLLFRHKGMLNDKVDVTSGGEKMPAVVVYVPDNGRNES